MASRATWRTEPGEPRSRGGSLAREGRRWTTLALKRALIVVLAFALYAFAIRAFAACTLLVLAALALRRAVPTRPRGPEPSVPSPGESFEATVEIRREGVPLGEDEVVVTFVEGWLHVEGNAVAFALSNVDAAETALEPIDHLMIGVGEGIAQIGGVGHPPPRSALSNRLVLTDGTELRFDARPRRDDARPGRYVLFAQSLARWREDVPALGTSILPPTRPHPSMRFRAATDLFVSTLGSAVGLGIAFRFGLGWGALAWLLTPGPPLHRAVACAIRQRRLARRM